jgi:hypothetical protein
VRFIPFALLLVAGCSSSKATVPGPPWLSNDAILVQGDGVTNTDCRTAICQHNENTDLIAWNGTIWLVHRTAKSQILGPDSALHVYQSMDNGNTFVDVAILPAPSDRDLRDPHFYVVGNQLFIEALTRLPVTSPRDTGVDTIAIAFRSSDGVNWISEGQIGPQAWSFWRPKLQGNTWYTAAYADGDLSIKLFSSTDGLNWTPGADVYTMSADTPVECELSFHPDGTMVAYVRMDGTDQELIGDQGRLRTKVCTAPPPYAQFDCSQEIDGERFDGPLSFTWQSRVFMVARKHLQPSARKRTALFELTNDVEVKEWGELPSAGDTSYAGMAMLDDHRALVSWYSSNLQDDANWVVAILDATDIWTGVIDLSQLQ